MSYLRQLRTEAGITQTGLARRAGVSKQHIMRIEQGLYHRLPDSIMHLYSQLSGETIAEIERQYAMELSVRYEELRREVQERAEISGGWEALLDRLSPQQQKYRDGSNLLIFREFLGYESRIEFCRTFAAHPATVLNYEKSKAKRLPTDLRSALSNSGVPEGVLNAL